MTTGERAWRRSPAGRAYQRRHSASKIARNKRLIREAKDRPCADCGRRYPFYVMEFHHVRGKKLFSLNGLRNGGGTVIRIRAEIAKCVVVCSNCHKEREYQIEHRD